MCNGKYSRNEYWDSTDHMIHLLHLGYWSKLAILGCFHDKLLELGFSSKSQFQNGYVESCLNWNELNILRPTKLTVILKTTFSNPSVGMDMMQYDLNLNQRFFLGLQFRVLVQAMTWWQAVIWRYEGLWYLYTSVRKYACLCPGELK